MVRIARDLLGKVLVTRIGDVVTAGVITETEAYAGIDDRASHAYRGRRTVRIEPMYAEGGTAYVYLCYGIHHLFNVVTGPRGTPHAVLVRAIRPIEGITAMTERRRPAKFTTAGPGTLTQALGIRTGHSGSTLFGPAIRIEDRGIPVPDRNIIVGPRVGIDYAGEDVHLPYRFRIAP